MGYWRGYDWYESKSVGKAFLCILCPTVCYISTSNDKREAAGQKKGQGNI